MSVSNLPWRITLDTNPDFCNLNCIMCEDHSPYSESRNSRKKAGTLRPIMKRKLMEKVIREAANLGVSEVIPSMMGEPLLYPYFDDILSLCNELGLTLNLTTNGTFPSRDKHQNVEYWAEKITPIGSDVKISWNGATEETMASVMPGSKLSEHIHNVKRFITVRDRVANKCGNYCSVTMQLTFMEINHHEIIDMVKLALKLGFDRVKGHHLWAHFPEIQDQSMRRDSLAIKRWNAIVSECHTIVAEHNLNHKKQCRLDNFFELDVTQIDNIAPGGECPFLGKEVWVDPNGRFNVCCAPDQQRKILGDFGDLNTKSLAQIWSGEDYIKLNNDYLSRPLCQGCNMRRPVEAI
jgi:MoaA/NifB/PqqE/SkfB family radical SAM enzyme